MTGKQPGSGHHARTSGSDADRYTGVTVDPETTKLVAIITASAALGGAVVGALIGWANAWSVAKASIQGQRALAEDAARRARRESHVALLRDRMRQRIDRYNALRPAFFQDDKGRFVEVLQSLRDNDLFDDPTWLVMVPANGQLKAALTGMVAADRKCIEQANRLGETAVNEGRSLREVWPAFNEQFGQLRQAIHAVNWFAEQYIADERPPPKPRQFGIFK